MKPRDTHPILMVRRLPLRLSSDELSAMANLRDRNSLGKLVEAKLLKPLGTQTTGARWFLTSEFLERASDRKWWDKVTDVVKSEEEDQKDK